jgi:hypothetical protein
MTGLAISRGMAAQSSAARRFRVSDVVVFMSLSHFTEIFYYLNSVYSGVLSNRRCLQVGFVFLSAGADRNLAVIAQLRPGGAVTRACVSARRRFLI